jgi:ABC-2 type transport system permease protein
MRSLEDIFRLGLKELRSLRHDTVLLALVLYAFTYAIYSAATGTSSELRHTAIAVVDEDRSPLSGRLADSFLKPYFREPREIPASAIDEAMDSGRYTFVLDIPPGFERDRAGDRPV